MHYRKPASHDVLVAEDEAMIRMLLEDELTDAGYRVIAVSNGDDALAASRITMPDVAVLDLHMPGVAGAELVRALRELRPDLPVVVITGDVFLDRARFTGDHGGAPAVFLEKPFAPDQLTAAVAAFIGQKQIDMSQETRALAA